MTVNCDIDVNKIPIRFLPEASTPLKSWLTRNNRELLTLEEIENDFKNNTPQLYWWISEAAARSLVELLVVYRRVSTKHLTIEIPHKYVKTVNLNNFIIE